MHIFYMYFFHVYLMYIFLVYFCVFSTHTFYISYFQIFFIYFYIYVHVFTYVYYILMCMCVHVTYVHVSKYFFMYIFFVCTFVHTCYREEKQPKHKQTNRTEKMNTEGPLSSHLWSIGGSGPIIWFMYFTSEYINLSNTNTCLLDSPGLTQCSPSRRIEADTSNSFFL